MFKHPKFLSAAIVILALVIIAILTYAEKGFAPADESELNGNTEGVDY
jgi:hypothetical protein